MKILKLKGDTEIMEGVLVSTLMVINGLLNSGDMSMALAVEEAKLQAQDKTHVIRDEYLRHLEDLKLAKDGKLYDSVANIILASPGVAETENGFKFQVEILGEYEA